MPKVTVRIDDKTYREIRTWCAQRDTCVSRVVQAFLRDLPRLKEVAQFPLPDAAPAPPPRPSQAELMAADELEMINLRIGQRR